MVEASGKEKMLKHYMIRSDFELDHYRDESYPVIEPHYHEFCEILYFISGHVDYVVGDELYHLRSDDILFLPPNLLHNPIFKDFKVPYERYVLWVSLPTMEQVLSVDETLLERYHSPKGKCFLLRNHSAEGDTFRTTFVALESAMKRRDTFYLAEVKSFLLHLMVEYYKALEHRGGTVQGGSRRELLTRILHYLQENMAGDLSLDAVAGHFYMDKFTLAHYFKDNIGVSFYQYVIQQRLLLGKNLLLEGIPANKVCYRCGFSDYSSFFRAFKKEYSVSPMEFKKIHRDLTREYPASAG